MIRDFKVIQEKFNKLDIDEQILFMLNHRHEIYVVLDNDVTDFAFSKMEDGEDNDFNYFKLKMDLGNRDGIRPFLNLLGFHDVRRV